MMKRETFEIARIYVPVKRRATLEPDKVAATTIAGFLVAARKH